MTKVERMHRRQLEKAALIANVDVDALTPSELVKLQVDLYEFLSASGLRGMRVPISNIRREDIRERTDEILVPRHYVPEIVKTLREKFVDIAVVAAAGVNADLAKVDLIQPTNESYAGFNIDVTARVTLQVRSGARSEPFSFKFSMEPTREAAEWALFYHLGHSGLSPDRVRFCPREGCDNVFVLGSHARIDRKRYCSIKCSQAMAAKAHRERTAEQERKSKGKKKMRRKVQVARLTAAAGKGARK